MAKKELNLLQFAAGGTAEASPSAAQIVRSGFVDTDLRGKLLDYVPNQFSVTPSPQALPALLTFRNTTARPNPGSSVRLKIEPDAGSGLWGCPHFVR